MTITVTTELAEGHMVRTQVGTLEHHRTVPARTSDATATLQLSKPFFLRMLTGGAGAKDLLPSDETKIEGSRIDLGRFFALLVKGPGNFPIVTR